MEADSSTAPPKMKDYHIQQAQTHECMQPLIFNVRLRQFLTLPLGGDIDVQALASGGPAEKVLSESCRFAGNESEAPEIPFHVIPENLETPC